MTDIPEDVKKLARLAFAQANRQAWWTNTREGEAIIARAILADRAAQAERIRRLEEALREIERLYWQEGSDASWRAAHMNGIARNVLNGDARAALGGNADA